ncbi:MAG: Uma2 family endonuclease [Gemmatimonadaceae bacterium]
MREAWTAERVRALPDDGNRYELIEGELVVTPSPRYVHQTAVLELLLRLNPWLRQTGTHRVLMSPADISLGEDEVLQPDVFVYRTVDGRAVRDWSDISSLVLVIDVLSPGTARYDRQLKRRRYQRAGVPEYWIVDLDSRLIERWRPADQRPEVLADRIVWQPDAEQSAQLEIDVEAFFAEIHGEA